MGFYRGICKECNQSRLLNKLDLCADCTNLEVYVKNKKLLDKRFV